MILTFGTNQMILLNPTAKATDALLCPSTGAQVGNDEESLQHKGRRSPLLLPRQAAWQLPHHGMGHLCSAPVQTLCIRRHYWNASALSPAAHLHFLPEEHSRGWPVRIPEDTCPNYGRST